MKVLSNTSISKQRPFASSSGAIMSTSKHKRAGTALIASSSKVSDSASSIFKSKKSLKKELNKHKISKEILKKLKKKTINQLDEKSRMSNLNRSIGNLIITTIKKPKGAPKDIPLPVSSTTKSLKKAIKDNKKC